jgi:signal transduction histidine kinase
MRASLRARLVWMAAVGTAVVVGVTSYLEKRVIEGAMESEALEAAGAAALGLAADVADHHDTEPTDADLADLVARYTPAVPTIRALTVVRPDGASVAASTEKVTPAGLLELGRQAIRQREMAVSAELPGPVRLVAVPMERDQRPYGAVVVTMSMEAVERMRRQTWMAALLFAPAAILVLTGLIDLLARRVVQRPLAGVHGTMRRAAAGDLEARAKVERDDEIGAVSLGLNAMLDRMSGFNAELRREVEHATGELRERNEQLVDSAQRLFAARHELARSQQLAVAGEMAASVAHQIGTPFNLISGYVQMILEDLPADSSAAIRLRTVQEQIGKVTRIVQDFLDQARRPVLLKRSTSPEGLVHNACELVRPTLEAAGIALRTQVEPALPEVEVDAGQIEQCLLNLMTNAIDATPRGGSLEVSARSGDGEVELEVRDTGCGIAPENLTRVFEPLFTTKHPGKGTGLGLTIVREVVAAHGGTIAVQSTPSRGTRITLRLPHAAAREAGHA